MSGDRKSLGTVTWQEVLQSDVLGETRMPVRTGLEQEIVGVRLVSDVEQVRTCRLGTIVVLDGPIASTVWAVEVAIRLAWERHLPCVISGLEESSAESVVRLAKRLEVSVGFQGGNLADFAMRLGSLVAYPEAVRSRLVARCAASLARQTTTDGVLRTLNSELADSSVALVDASGRIVSGSKLSTMTGPDVVRVELDPLDFAGGRALVSLTQARSAARAETTKTILQIARSQLVACEAPRRATVLEQSAHERWALEQLIAAAHPCDDPGTDESSPPTRPAQALARELGWTSEGPLIGAVLIPRAELAAAEYASVTAALRSIWPRGRTGMRPVEHAEGWALWAHLEVGAVQDQVERAALLTRATDTFAASIQKVLRRRGETLDVRAGLGGAVDSLEELPRTLSQARLAAVADRDGPAGGLVRYSRLTLLDYVSSTADPQLLEVASETLGSLLEHDDGAQLLTTLRAFLDCGGSTGPAAERLGLHRNTVSARLSRIRAAGVDVDDPDQRLVIHFASHLLADRAARRR